MRGRGMAYGMRMAAELVGAVIVGGFIGIGLDWLIGTKPWLFLLFFVLGFAAGVLNVVRAYERMQKEIAARTGGRLGHDGAGRRGLRGSTWQHRMGANQGAGMPDPIHQFEIHPLIPIKLFGWDVSFTNSSAVHAAGRAC